MRRLFWGAVLSFFAVSFPVKADFGDPLRGLTAEQLIQFDEGKDAFEDEEDAIKGLGPVFNEASCKTCHIGPEGTAAEGAVGGTNERLEFRFGKNVDGVFDPLASQGGSLIQDHGIGEAAQYFYPYTKNPHYPDGQMPDACTQLGSVNFVPEQIPEEANVTAGRRTTPLFGLGLVNALSDDQIRFQAFLEILRDLRTAGLVSVVPNPDPPKFSQNRVGRFGWKAQVSTLHVFAGDAYLNEMGITSPSFPEESAPQGRTDILACNPFPQMNDDGDDVDHFADFMSFLAPPPRGAITDAVTQGQRVFGRIGCANCHTPTWRTGSNPVAALSQQTFHPFSDFLLHDMGSLGDGITQNLATGRLMRTQPLWGLRVQTKLLHDGRADDPDPDTRLVQAIEAHDGQGSSSRLGFNGLSPGDRANLLAFLNSL